MEIRVYLTQTYKSSVGIRRNGHDFGCISSLSVNKRQRAQELYQFRLPFSERWSFRREHFD